MNIKMLCKLKGKKNSFYYIKLKRGSKASGRPKKSSVTDPNTSRTYRLIPLGYKWTEYVGRDRVCVKDTCHL